MTKKILITGINGFIGSNCANYFVQKSYEVFGIDILGEKSEKFIQGEVDLNNLISFNQQFDIIVHLAGSGTVGLAQQCPELEHLKNVGSTENILEYIRHYNKNAKLLYSSSAAVYGDSSQGFISETEELNPISVYGKHKLEVEKLCQKYSKEYNLDIKIIRFFSIYGEGLKKQLLWDFCNRVVNNINSSKLHCFGTGEEKRDFIHIKDAIGLIDILINQNNCFEIINCATGISTRVIDVLKRICTELEFRGELVFDNINREGDPQSIVANTSKAISLGFTTKIKLAEGIRNYVKWFKQSL